jgi:hypothetical protein
MDTNETPAPLTKREKAREFVRSILTNDFKQKADDALVDSVAERILKAFPVQDGRAT